MGGDGKMYCTLASKAKQVIYPVFCLIIYIHVAVFC